MRLLRTRDGLPATAPFASLTEPGIFFFFYSSSSVQYDDVENDCATCLDMFGHDRTLIRNHDLQAVKVNELIAFRTSIFPKHALQTSNNKPFFVTHLI
jgi:nitrogen fixation-related uncharacterized protein